MSIGDDEYDEQGRTVGTGTSTRRGPARGTRTRLPGEDGDVYGVGRQSSGRPGRSLLMVVGVVVLLVAAIAFANRNGASGPNDERSGSASPDTRPTAPTGERPVQGADAATGIPSGFAHTRQGAQSAAANYAVALGGDGMFNRDTRHSIVDAVYAPASAEELKGKQDKAYSEELLDRMGLDPRGAAPAGKTFVSRTVPVGTNIASYEDSKASVSVWYMGLIGMAGAESQDPVRTTWKTWTFNLQWVNGDWKIIDDDQKDGPAPVPGDSVAANSDEISRAAEEFGGFTYAR
ncbi:hypothetical protein [Streptomyces sp. TR06-5]|uniref:hypothetical protein n=1 Tax=unclassified Streptomyces TaxID=2593676 RepID=UPI00399FDC80